MDRGELLYLDEGVLSPPAGRGRYLYRVEISINHPDRLECQSYINAAF